MTQAALAEELHLENKLLFQDMNPINRLLHQSYLLRWQDCLERRQITSCPGRCQLEAQKLMQAEAILQGMKLDKTLDAAIKMLMTLKGLEQ